MLINVMLIKKNLYWLVGWFNPSPSDGWGCGKTPWKSNSLDHDQRWKMSRRKAQMQVNRGGGKHPVDGARVR